MSEVTQETFVQFLPKTPLPVPDFDISKPVPSSVISAWLRKGDVVYHGAIANWVDINVESVIFQAFPEGECMAALGKMLPASKFSRIPVAVVTIDREPFWATVYEMFRTFTTLSIPPTEFIKNWNKSS